MKIKKAQLTLVVASAMSLMSVSCSGTTTTITAPTTTTPAPTTHDATEQTAPTAENTEEPDFVGRSYASDYSVPYDEAMRRLDRTQPVKEILAAIRELESNRVAGWGVDHVGPFTGWVWLTGDQPPNADAARIADAHDDVEIRLGAAHTHNELLQAQDGLFDIGPIGTEIPPEIKRMVTFTGINMAANAIRIGIDPTIADPDLDTMTDEAFQAKAAEITKQLQGKVSVAFVIEDGRWLGDDAGEMEELEDPTGPNE